MGTAAMGTAVMDTAAMGTAAMGTAAMGTAVSYITIPNASQTHPKRVPNASQTRPKRIPNASRTHPKRIPNASPTHALDRGKGVPHEPQTLFARIHFETCTYACFSEPGGIHLKTSPQRVGALPQLPADPMGGIPFCQ